MDLVSLSLEDIIKRESNRRGGSKSSGSRGGGGGGTRRGGSSSSSSRSIDTRRPRRGNNHSGGGSGPVRRGRFNNRSQPFPSSQRSEGDWSHDLYDDDDDDDDDQEGDEEEIIVAPTRHIRRGGSSSTSTSGGRFKGTRSITVSKTSTSGGITLGHTVELTNLSYSVKDADLEDLFSGVGELRSATVITDPSTGRSTGVAHVVFCRLVDAKSAVTQFDQQVIEGRKVNAILADDSAPDFSSIPVRKSFRGSRRGGSDSDHWRGGSRSSSSTSTSSSRPDWLQHDTR